MKESDLVETHEMSKILLLFAHPSFEKSKLNRSLLAAAREVSGITIHDLYEEYPYFDIDVQHEQSLLLEHDTIILQHPLYWYSTPSLVKEWFDLVLEHGWAFGETGNKLKGKRILQAITAGGSRESYQPDGSNRYSIPQFLRPVEQTSALCGMEWLPPFVVHSSIGATEKATSQYVEILEGLRDGSLDLRAAAEFELMDDYLETLTHA